MLSDVAMQIIGVISVILTWCAIAFILLVNLRVLEKSVSHHAAMDSKNHFIFAILMSVSLIALSAFIYFWLIPAYNLSILFVIVVSLAIVLEFITTWVPLTSGWRHTVHQICSYGAALLLPVLTILTALSPGVSNITMWVSFGSLGVMLALLCMFVFVKSVRRHYLIYQNIYILAFHISLLSTLYSGQIS